MTTPKNPNDISMHRDTIKLSAEEKKSTLMVAHRGVSWLERENTCAAFIAAGQRSYFGVECDIHRSLDGEFVVMHDSGFARVAGVDKKIRDLTYKECQEITLYDYDGESKRCDLRAPLFEEYIKILSHYGKVAVPELKDDFNAEELDRIVETTKKYGHFEKTVFITFLWDVAKLLREKYPEATIQFLASVPGEGVSAKEHEDKLLEIAKNYNMDLDVHHSVATKEFIERVHAIGHKINVWTVNTKERAAELCSYGIDYITTNIIE